MGDFFGSPKVQYTTPPLPEYIQNYLRTAADWLRGQVGVPGTPYPGQLMASVTPEELQNIPGVQAQIQAAQDAASRMLQQRIQAARQEFIGMGQGQGTPLMNVEAQFTGQAAPALAGQIGGLLQSAYGQELARQQTGISNRWQDWLRQQQQQWQAAGFAPFNIQPQPVPQQYGASPFSSLLTGGLGLLSSILSRLKPG